jgi:hypothetical protein
VSKFVSQVVDAIKRLIPDTCPHCKTNLSLRPALAKELLEMGQRLEATVPAPEYTSRSQQEDGG